MARSQTNLGWDVLLDVSGRGARHEQLARALRKAIRDGVLGQGAALPPSRKLADDLSCSRWVVTQAYAQLVAEGYLVARTGSATRVSWSGVLDRSVPPRPSPSPPRYDLAPGLPDLRAFPRRRWADALREVLSSVPHTDLGVPVPGGHPRLRAVLAEYLRRCRGAVTEDVLICSGVTSGVTLVGRALHAAGITRVVMEEPGWPRVRQAATTAGLTVVSVPVDAEGLCVDQIPDGVRAVIVTPAHQFPSGVVLTPARRAALLAWARAVDGLILEDDYDAEFRYDRRPVGTVQGMDPRRVVLLGSVSKTLSPALGIGWCVVPPQWTLAVTEANPTASAPPVLDQLALAAFIEQGSYDRYLRAARLRYRNRRDTMVSALENVSGAAAGLHLLLHLDSDATSVVQHAAANGLRLVSLDSYRSAPGDPALVLGYGNVADGSLPAAITVLQEALTAGRSG
ncbi:GntR family transcriptional regulator/MocR family aminotransferase [Kibdelosporangium banguiense]|uniref:GntR family transcriptional regulator/MocR family aminotransferase n=1 Tax=Kibdelosporangium banguiense TaxID=1365924 RepID=A0ABS4TBY9_9PSEU|nr:PLP-dependent aminotransferase family protein [Kibdelosporangium banguiense]MBP2321947.1 GntR family transcriptional regulator/MocR family aminotransferase [Kibdelosporangium banguiense]